MKAKFYVLSIINILLELLMVIGAIAEGGIFAALFSSGPFFPIAFIVLGYFIARWFIKSERKTALGIILFILCIPGALISIIAVLIITVIGALFLGGGSNSSSPSSSSDNDEYTEYYIDDSQSSMTVIRTKTGAYVTEVDYVNSDGDYVGKNGAVYHFED